MSSTFDAVRFDEYRLATGTKLGSPLSAVALTGSTNDDALHAARTGAPQGATFVADEQSAGRGRRGHEWTSPPGENLLFSVLLRPTIAPEGLSSLTLAVGLAVRDAAATEIDAKVGVKWPNDVVVEGRKLSGILVESQLEGSRVSALVVGIGLNVSMTRPPPGLEAVATSLAMLGAHRPERERMLAAVLTRLERRTDDFLRSGIEPMLDDLRRHDALAGREVVVEGVRGTAVGIARDGSLLLRRGDGVRKMSSGTVQLAGT